MKRSLITLAVLSALTSNVYAVDGVTLYGIADLGISYNDNGAGNNLELTSGNQSGSRLGIKGEKQVSSGLTAIAVLEAGFNLDTGDESDSRGRKFFNRQAFAGVKGGFGIVKLGRQETPMYAAYNSGIDPFGRGLAGDMTAMFPIASTTSGRPFSGNTRTDNTINYSLPENLGGVYGQAAYTFGEQREERSAGRQFGLAVGYKNGPLNVIYAYHDANNVPAAATDTTPAGPSIEGRSNLIGAVYDFGFARAHVAYGDNKNEGTPVAASSDTRTWMVGTSVPFGPHAILASYARVNDRAVANRDADRVALGYTYQVSKEFNFYTSYARTDNDPAGTVNVSTRGATGDVLNAGFRYRF